MSKASPRKPVAQITRTVASVCLQMYSYIVRVGQRVNFDFIFFFNSGGLVLMMDVIVPVWGILEFYQSLRPVVFINHFVVINQSPAIVCITDNHIKIIDTITRWE